MKNWVDLHMHTVASPDGDISPVELIERCVAADLKIVSIADHNTVTSIAEGVDQAKKRDICLIPAIEIDCCFKDTNFHLLGYGIDYQSSKYRDIDQNYLDLEFEAAEYRIDLFRKMGLAMDREKMEKLAGKSFMNGEIMVEVALEDPRNDHIEFLDPYRPGGSRSDNPLPNAFWDLCVKGKPAYVAIDYPPLTDMVEVILEDGGVPILAHPKANMGLNADLLESLVDVGLKGVEVYSSYHDDEALRYYKAAAEKLGIIQTAGSDYHGRSKPGIHLGEMDCPEQGEMVYRLLSAIGC